MATLDCGHTVVVIGQAVGVSGHRVDCVAQVVAICAHWVAAVVPPTHCLLYTSPSPRD